MIIVLGTMLNGFRKAGWVCPEHPELLKVRHCDTPVPSPPKYMSLQYDSLPLYALCASIKNWHYVCHPNALWYCLPSPRWTGTWLPWDSHCHVDYHSHNLSLLFVSLARQSANAESKHCRKKSASFVPWTPDLVCRSAKASYQRGSW